MTTPIARTKLRPPEPRTPYIARPHLVERLQAGAARKLTLLIAGAGYGKSTLLAEWARQNANFLWYNLDLVDRDPAVFFAHLFAGLEERWPNAGRAGQAVLNQPVAPDPQHLALLFLNALEQQVWSGTLLLVLDDYHRLGDAPAMDATLSLILERLPDGVHVVVAARLPISLPTARLQAAGVVNELTSSALSFTTDELLQLFPDLATLSAPVQQLIDRTAGWVTGLQLLRQTLAHRTVPTLESSAQATSDSLDQVYRYFAEEVFKHQPLSLQQFLLQTSMLETFSPPDSDAIFGRTDSEAWLIHLMTHGLFTIRRQRDPDIFSYHHLLVDFLRDRLRREGEPTEVRTWHLQAARYYDERQQWHEAFAHALTADEDLAAEIIIRAMTSMRYQGRLETIQHWLDQISPNGYTSHPTLYCCRATLLQDQGRYEQALAACKQAIALAEPQADQRTLFRAWHLSGNVLNFIGDLVSARQAYQKAQAYAQSGTPQEQLGAQYGLVISYLGIGQNRQADELLRQLLVLALPISKAVETQIMAGIGTVQSLLGNRAEAIYWHERSLALRREAGLTPGIVGSLSNLGFNQTRTGDLVVARANLEEAIALGGQGHHPSVLANTWSNLADVDAVEGNFQQAEECYRRSIELKEPLRDISGLAWTWMRLSELRRQQQDVASALEFADRALSIGKQLGPNERLPLQTGLALAWLDQGKSETAIEQLEQVCAAHRTTTENQYELTYSLWHLARAQRASGQDGYAALAEALTLAARWNYQFLLLTLARQNPALLAEAVAADFQPAFVKRVLLQLGEVIVPKLRELLNAPDPAVRRRAVEQLVTIATDLVWMPLDQATDDVDPLVKTSALAALARLQQIAPPPLRITTLGRFSLQRGDDLISNEAWQGNRQAQRLFKYLLACNGHSVHRDKLMELFWPDAKSLDAARRGLNQAVFMIRQTLEPALPRRHSRYLQTEGETYRLLLPTGSWVDDQAFVDAIEHARQAQQRNDAEAALTNYQAAVDLYGGNYLEEESYQDWALRRQEALQRQVITALDAVVELRLQRDEPTLALAAAERLLQIDALREESYALLIQLYLEQGRPEAAQRIYRQYEAAYCVEMNCSPSPAMYALYERILKKL